MRPTSPARLVRNYVRNPTPKKYQELRHLADYLRQGEESERFRLLDLIYCCWHAFDRSAVIDEAIQKATDDKARRELVRYRDDLVEQEVHPDSLSQRALDAIAEVADSEPALDWLVRHDPAEAPTWSHVHLRDIEPQPQWLVHFTDEPHSIYRHGFRGVADVRLLGLTTYVDPVFKDDPNGYAFAYTPAAADAYGFERGRPRYGKHMVIFQAPHVNVWHHADGEPQAIFWAPDARNIFVDIGGSRREWWVTDAEGESVEFESIDEMVDWLDENLEQMDVSFPAKPGRAANAGRSAHRRTIARLTSR